jgi:hypothetical protein
MLADSSTSAYVRNRTFLVTQPIIIMGTDMSTLLPDSTTDTDVSIVTSGHNYMLLLSSHLLFTHRIDRER